MTGDSNRADNEFGNQDIIAVKPEVPISDKSSVYHVSS